MRLGNGVWLAALAVALLTYGWLVLEPTRRLESSGLAAVYPYRVTLSNVFRMTDPSLSPTPAPVKIGEGAGVGYATAPDRTLIRWFWSGGGNPTFRVYKSAGSDAERLIATVAPANDGSGKAILNQTDARWPNLFNDLLDAYGAQGVRDIPGLQAYIRANPLLAQQLANDRYPVALLIGWGYLDRDFRPEGQYTYRVEAVLSNSAPVTLGSVTLRAGRFTQVGQRIAANALDLGPGSAYRHPQDGDWATAQQNRRFDRKVYVGWSIEREAKGFPSAWVAGYDIYRAPASTPDLLVPVNGSHPIQPMPSYTATVDLRGPAKNATGAYQQVPFYYVDEVPAAGDYVYRVAPRDLLGWVQLWQLRPVAVQQRNRRPRLRLRATARAERPRCRRASIE